MIPNHYPGIIHNNNNWTLAGDVLKYEHIVRAYKYLTESTDSTELTVLDTYDYGRITTTKGWGFIYETPVTEEEYIPMTTWENIKYYLYWKWRG